MIKPTDEMVQLAVDIFLANPDPNISQIDAGMAEALTAVFAIVERDHGGEAPTPAVDERCWHSDECPGSGPDCSPKVTRCGHGRRGMVCQLPLDHYGRHGQSTWEEWS